MNVRCFTFNPFLENTYVLYDETKDCIIIDPGCYNKKEENTLKEFIISEKLNPKKVINTHCHIDHILGNKFVCKSWRLELYMHKADLDLLKNSEKISVMYGLENYKISPLPKYLINEGDTINFGKTSLEILFTPGHSPGHICLYNRKKNILIGGDVIFKNSIGRSDLPGGDYDTLINSIQSKILILPDKTKIFCGHGPTTSVGIEKKQNPFLK